MTAPNGMQFRGYQRFAGHAVNDSVVHEGLVTDYKADVGKLLRPLVDSIWEECGLDRPDKDVL